MNKQEIEKTIEVLRDFDRCVRVKADGAYETIDFINAKETAISALEQQLTNGWIPVSERLPLSNAYHVVYVTLKHKESEVSFSAKMIWKNGRLKWFNGKTMSDNYELVAWQKEYMPAPYKEVSE